MANGSADCLGPTSTPLIKIRVMAARKRLRVEKWPLGKQPTVCPEVVLERGVKYGKDGGVLRHYWYHVSSS